MFPGLKLGGNGPLLEGNESANFQLDKQVFMALKYQITLFFFRQNMTIFVTPPVCFFKDDEKANKYHTLSRVTHNSRFQLMCKKQAHFKKRKKIMCNVQVHTKHEISTHVQISEYHFWSNLGHVHVF